MYVTYYNTLPTKYGLPRNKYNIMDILLGKTTTQQDNKVYDFQPKEFITKWTNTHSHSVIDIYNENIRKIMALTLKIVTFIRENDFTNTKENFYQRFTIPKVKGGVRHLINPKSELKQLQREILDFLYEDLKILPHNAAHGFTKKRDAVTNATIHKNSKYIYKMDIKDFFPSITKNILKEKLKDIHIFALDTEVTNTFLDNITEIATLDNCLPQGSPLSPYLSNLIMLPVDYAIEKTIKLKELPYFWYTRYADDMTFSSKSYHNHLTLIQKIKEILYVIFNNQIKLNESKTKVLKNTGKCFITGVKLNKDNNLTIGHEKKTMIKHELFNLFIALQNGTITKEQTQATLGLLSFMYRIEPDYTNYLSKKMLQKFHSNALTLSQHFKEYL